MKQLLATLLFIASTIYTTSCSDPLYYDAIPLPISTMTIPAEGGRFEFKVVNYIHYYDETRFQPGKWYKEFRYRIVEDGVISKESTMHDTSIEYGSISIEFTPNETNHTKEYTIEIQIAEDFHSVGEDQHFGKWQPAWLITQPCLTND